MRCFCPFSGLRASRECRELFSSYILSPVLFWQVVEFEHRLVNPLFEHDDTQARFLLRVGLDK